MRHEITNVYIRYNSKTEVHFSNQKKSWGRKEKAKMTAVNYSRVAGKIGSILAPVPDGYVTFSKFLSLSKFQSYP